MSYVTDETLNEEWRPVVGYEDAYEVSSIGRVRSLDRVIVTRAGVERPLRGRDMKLGIDKDGYKKISLSSARGPNSLRVNRLVLEAFLGPCPDGMEGCHNNGVCDDNRVENLRWDTGSGNQRDRRKHGTNHELNKTHCPRGHSLSGDLRQDKLVQGKRTCTTCANDSSRALVRVWCRVAEHLDMTSEETHYWHGWARQDAYRILHETEPADWVTHELSMSPANRQGVHNLKKNYCSRGHQLVDPEPGKRRACKECARETQAMITKACKILRMKEEEYRFWHGASRDTVERILKYIPESAR